MLTIVKGAIHTSKPLVSCSTGIHSWKNSSHILGLHKSKGWRLVPMHSFTLPHYLGKDLSFSLQYTLYIYILKLGNLTSLWKHLMRVMPGRRKGKAGTKQRELNPPPLAGDPPPVHVGPQPKPVGPRLWCHALFNQTAPSPVKPAPCSHITAFSFPNHFRPLLPNM